MSNYELPPQRLGNLLDAEKRVDFVRSTGNSSDPTPSCSSSGDPDDIPEGSGKIQKTSDTCSSWEYRQIIEARQKTTPKVVKKEVKEEEDVDDVIILDEDVKLEEPTSSDFSPRDLNQFLKAAKEGDLKELKRFIGKIPVDSEDFYGWTATMCAAAEGQFEVCKLLLENGADPGIRDRQGFGLLDIAKRNGKREFVKRIMEYYCRSSKPSSSAPVEMSYCEACDVFIPEDTTTAHISSITHQLNDDKKARGAAPQSGIHLGPSNIGYRLMCASGWTEEQGLGRNSDGQRFPIRTILKRNRTGLGMEQPPKKVTHFGPFDRNAVRQEKKPPVVTKKELVAKMKKEDRIAKKFRADFSESDNVYDYFHGK